MITISQGERRRLQLAQLRIAAEVADLCDAHEINYALLAGSALGARRHRGFIPWDDDMDIGMVRDEYERFIAVAKTELSRDLYVQDWREDPHMGAPFTKIRLNGTRMIEESSKDTGGHKGIFIDIFPSTMCLIHPCNMFGVFNSSSGSACFDTNMDIPSEGSVDCVGSEICCSVQYRRLSLAPMRSADCTR